MIMLKTLGKSACPRVFLAVILAGLTSLSHGAAFTFEGTISGSLDLGAGAVDFVGTPFTLTGELIDTTPDAFDSDFATFFQSTSNWDIAEVGVLEGDVGSSYFIQAKNLFSMLGFSTGPSLLESFLGAVSFDFSIADINGFEPQLFTTNTTFTHPVFGQFGGIGAPSSVSNSSGHTLSILSGELTSAESVSGVPLPATTWLIGSALLGLGVARRKKA